MKKILKIVPFVLIAVLVGVTAVYAGNTLTPPASVSNTMYSLTDIYNLASGTTANEGTGEIDATPSEVSLSGKSLSDVYEAISNEITKLTPDILLSGNTVFGVEGEAEEGSFGVDLSNMWNGTGDEATGGSQVNGGIDDANYDSNYVPQTPPEDRYESTWEQCIESNDYCGTDTNNNQVNDSGANAKDLATGLVWSYPLKDAGGATFDTAPADLTGCDTGNCAYWNTDTTYSWNSSNANNDTDLPEGDTIKLTAQELCSQHTGWFLPHQKQLMQAYIDGSYGNLEPIGVDRFYWSATTVSSNAGDAWSVNLSYGSTSNNFKNSYYSVRCIRE